MEYNFLIMSLNELHSLFQLARSKVEEAQADALNWYYSSHKSPRCLRWPCETNIIYLVAKNIRILAKIAGMLI